MEVSFARGDVVLVRLNPNKGAEMGKIRPAVVLTHNSLITAGLPLVFIVPLSSKNWPELSGLRVEILPRERLLKPSFAVLEQARSVDLSRIEDVVLTRLTNEELQQIETKLFSMLGFSI